jgi:hypothetical protein
MFTGTKPTRVIETATGFLVWKGVCIFDKEFTYIRLFSFEGKNFLSPNLFVIYFWFMNYVDST